MEDNDQISIPRTSITYEQFSTSCEADIDLNSTFSQQASDNEHTLYYTPVLRFTNILLGLYGMWLY